MITIKNNPDIALLKLTKEILFSLVNHEFGIILGKLSHEYGKWTKERINDELLRSTNGKWVSEFVSILKPANPEISGDENMYEYKHRIPVNGGWSNSQIVLRIHKKFASSYAIELVGFSKLNAS